MRSSQMYRCIQLQYCIIVLLGCTSSTGTYVYPKQSQPFLQRRTNRLGLVQEPSSIKVHETLGENDEKWSDTNDNSSSPSSRAGAKNRSPINIRSAAALLLHSLRQQTLATSTALSAIASTSLAEEQQVQKDQQEEDEELVAAIAEAEATDSSVVISAPRNNKESVHLKLNSEAMLPRKKENDVKPSETKDTDEEPEEAKKQLVEAKEETTEIETKAVDDDSVVHSKEIEDAEKAEPVASPPALETKKETAMFHTYKKGKWELHGLNVSKRKFEAWVKYTTGYRDAAPNLITTKTLDLSSTHQKQDAREDLRRLWKDRTLVCDRTELLTRYNSDEENTEEKRNEVKQEDEDVVIKGEDDDGSNPQTPPKKRGGFEDLLHLYADRFAGILQDEMEETEALSALLTQEQTIPPEHRDVGMLTWLQREYGLDLTSQMQSHHLLAQPKEKQYETMQHFLDWFRSQFPYYYDKCDACHASLREDKANEPTPEATDDVIAEDEKAEQDDDNDEDDDNGTFLGYVFPAEEELKGKAGRTELYHCHKCSHFTRFPRCNSAKAVLENRRGRCGEYSMLLYRMLRSLGHDARWVVDWADHVWAEVRLPSSAEGEAEEPRWIHLDPCEAAMDDNLLYENWGKQQTYIMAFHTPTPCPDDDESAICLPSVPLIEDVTSQYTSDTQQRIQGRREESAEDMQESLEKVTTKLDTKLQEVLKR